MKLFMLLAVVAIVLLACVVGGASFIDVPLAAVTVTTVFDGVDTFIADVEATADADSAAVIAHGLGAIPVGVTLTLFGASTGAAGRLSAWQIADAGIDATNVNLLKSTAAGSGGIGTSVRVYIRRPHTIGR